MKILKTSLARRISSSRIGGTKVKLAGRTALLPNMEVPTVIQRLTAAQIDAIPQDRFTVSVVDSGPIVLGHYSGGGGGGKSSLHALRQKGKIRKGKIGNKTSSFVINPSSIDKVEINGTQFYTTIVTLLNKARESADSLYDINIKLTQEQRHSTSQKNHSKLFLPPIDEGNMTGCIKKAIAHFFNGKEICKICGIELKPTAFCLLMHDYFRRINILENQAHTPFCKYLKDCVLPGMPITFTSRTFINYANDYKDYEEAFTNPDKLDINFNVHPKTTGTFQDAFHEIGYYFHKSEYFERLRDMRSNLGKFGI